MRGQLYHTSLLDANILVDTGLRSCWPNIKTMNKAIFLVCLYGDLMRFGVGCIEIQMSKPLSTNLNKTNFSYLAIQRQFGNVLAYGSMARSSLQFVFFPLDANLGLNHLYNIVICNFQKLLLMTTH